MAGHFWPPGLEFDTCGVDDASVALSKRMLHQHELFNSYQTFTRVFSTIDFSHVLSASVKAEAVSLCAAEEGNKSDV